MTFPYSCCLYFLNLMHLLMEGVSIPEKTQAEYGNVAKFKFTESIMVAFLRAKIQLFVETKQQIGAKHYQIIRDQRYLLSEAERSSQILNPYLGFVFLALWSCSLEKRSAGHRWEMLLVWSPLSLFSHMSSPLYGRAGKNRWKL